jgi:deoxyribodipyrimidine photolyase
VSGKELNGFFLHFQNHTLADIFRRQEMNGSKEMNQLFVANGISFLTSKDQVIFEKSEVVKDDGNPYVVYTPYSKKWKDNFRKIEEVDSTERLFFLNLFNTSMDRDNNENNHFNHFNHYNEENNNSNDDDFDLRDELNNQQPNFFGGGNGRGVECAQQ